MYQQPLRYIVTCIVKSEVYMQSGQFCLLTVDTEAVAYGKEGDGVCETPISTKPNIPSQ